MGWSRSLHFDELDGLVVILGPMSLEPKESVEGIRGWRIQTGHMVDILDAWWRHVFATWHRYYRNLPWVPQDGGYALRC